MASLARRPGPRPRTALSDQPTRVEYVSSPTPFWLVELMDLGIVVPAALATGAGLLRERGMRIAIDDLGSGYAGLRHIVELHPDVLKIDRHVVSGARHDPLRRTVAAAVATVAAHMGALVVAEGIETADERDAVEMLGVTAGQGFHLAPPAFPQAAAERSTSAARAHAP